MRLIIQYPIGDVCTWSTDETFPVIYESSEAFLVDFEQACFSTKASYTRENSWPSTFVFAGREWDHRNHFDYETGKEFITPTIMTIDEYFKDC